MLATVIAMIFLAVFDTQNIGAYIGTAITILVLMLVVLTVGLDFRTHAKEPIEPEYNNVLDEEAFYKWTKANPGPSTSDCTAWKNDCDYYKHVFDDYDDLTEEPECARQSFSNVRKLPNE